MNNIKEEILEYFEGVKLIDGKDDELVGYAEMFGNDCIPLYDCVNFFSLNPDDAIKNISGLNVNSRTADGFDNCIIGHLKLDSDVIVLLYSKSLIIEQLKTEYLEDNSGLFNDEDDCETSAIEYYEYNILGTYMDGIPAFAVLYSK